MSLLVVNLLMVLVVSAQAALISKDCSQIGSSSFYTNPSSTLGTSTCSPKQCTMVTNTPASVSTVTKDECLASASDGLIKGGLSTTKCDTYSYAFTKAEVFKNLEPKTCVAKNQAATDYPDICSRDALKKNFMLTKSTDSKAHEESGVRLLYCNDQYLVIHTVNIQNHPTGLADNPHPPGDLVTNKYDTQGVTRFNMVQYSVYKIPLKARDLGTSAVTNNMGRFSEAFSALATTTTSSSTIIFSAETSGFVHSGYVVSGTGITSNDPIVLMKCDSAEIIAGTAGTSSTTLTIAWTIWGSVCSGSKTSSSCDDDNTVAGKYVKISSTWIKINKCVVNGGVGVCTLASAQTVASGTTLYVKVCLSMFILNEFTGMMNHNQRITNNS